MGRARTPATRNPLTPPIEVILNHDDSRKIDVFAIIFIVISIMIKMLAIYL